MFRQIDWGLGRVQENSDIVGKSRQFEPSRCRVKLAGRDKHRNLSLGEATEAFAHRHFCCKTRVTGIEGVTGDEQRIDIFFERCRHDTFKRRERRGLDNLANFIAQWTRRTERTIQLKIGGM